MARTKATVVCLALGALLAAGCASAAGSAAAPVRRSAADAPLGDAGPSPAGPHDSLGAFVDSHFAAEAWREDVGHGYFESSAVWLPAGLAVGAGAIAHWDHTISRRASDRLPAPQTKTPLLSGGAFLEL